MVLLQEDHGPVRLLVLNRPEKRNALSMALMGGLLEALRAAAADPAVAGIVIAANGPGFSAGADLGERTQMMADPAQRDARAALADALLAAPGALGKPVVVALHGPVVGAGASLALCCDLAYAAEGTRFLWPEAKHGMYPSLVAPQLLRHLSPRDVFDLLATGRPMLAEEAATLRLVNRVVPEAALRATAIAAAAAAAQYPPEMLRRLKREIDAGGLAR